MARGIIIAVLGVLLGVFLGNGIARITARHHQHTRAIMGLAQFHLERLRAAASGGACARFNQERERLLQMDDELLQAFPLAYAQDTEFHSRADALREALQKADGTEGHCAGAVASGKSIDDACEDCHREYR
jgi:hypothetical protein